MTFFSQNYMKFSQLKKKLWNYENTIKFPKLAVPYISISEYKPLGAYTPELLSNTTFNEKLHIPLKSNLFYNL